MQYLKRSFRVFMPSTDAYRKRWEETFGGKTCPQLSSGNGNSGEPECEQSPKAPTKENSLPVLVPKSEGNVF